MASLFDWDNNLFLSLHEGGTVNFDKTIRELIPDPKSEVERALIEQLLEMIQVSHLLGIIHPDFVDHPSVFDEDYRSSLELWEKRFNNFLANSKGCRFHRM